MTSGVYVRSESVRQRFRELKIGTTHSDETKKRIRESLKGNTIRKGMKHSEETKQKIRMALLKRVVKGHAHTEETKQKISKAVSGSNNPRWNGGLSFEPYCVKFNSEFKRRVRDFFGNVCVECGGKEKSRKLSVHHVNFNKESCCDNSQPLFVPLCYKCHARTNVNRTYWEERFTTLIREKYNGKCYFTKEELAIIRPKPE